MSARRPFRRFAEGTSRQAGKPMAAALVMAWAATGRCSAMATPGNR